MNHTSEKSQKDGKLRRKPHVLDQPKEMEPTDNFAARKLFKLAVISFIDGLKSSTANKGLTLCPQLAGGTNDILWPRGRQKVFPVTSLNRADNHKCSA